MYFKAARLLLFGLGLLGAGALFGAFGYALAGMTFAISGLVYILLCTCVVPDAYYPPAPPQLFADRQSFAEFCKGLEQAEEVHALIWYMYNLPPHDFLNLIRVVVELRDASNQEGMRRVLRLIRKEPENDRTTSPSGQ